MAKFAGGTKVDSKGYLSISAGPHRGRRVHILVAEAMLGRKLAPDEEVDHRNGDRKDCAYTNLKVMSGPDHTRLENRRRWVMRHIKEKERRRWEEWVETGTGKPSAEAAVGEAEVDVEVGANSIVTSTDEDSSFNPEEFGNGNTIGGEADHGDI